MFSLKNNELTVHYYMNYTLRIVFWVFIAGQILNFIKIKDHYVSSHLWSNDSSVKQPNSSCRKRCHFVDSLQCDCFELFDIASNYPWKSAKVPENMNVHARKYHQVRHCHQSQPLKMGLSFSHLLHPWQISSC